MAERRRKRRREEQEEEEDLNRMEVVDPLSDHLEGRDIKDLKSRKATEEARELPRQVKQEKW